MIDENENIIIIQITVSQEIMYSLPMGAQNIRWQSYLVEAISFH